MLTRRLKIVCGLVIALFVIGTTGYWLIEGWSLLDALYMTTITVGTVGFGEIHPLSSTGRMFTIFLILGGVGTFAYAFTVVTEYLVGAELSGQLRRRRMERNLAEMSNHVIVCGYGRVGQNAADVIRRENRRQVVVIDGIESFADQARDDGFHALHGDATIDETLYHAGVERASGIIVATGNDSVNLFVVLSARALNSDLNIVARSSMSANESKMIRAGANKVVSPYDIGGKRMANSLLKPHLTEFLDVVSFDDDLELWLEEVMLPPTSPLVGMTVAELNLRQRTGVTLVAVLRHSGEKLLTVEHNTRFDALDELIVIGKREQLATLDQLILSG